MMRKTLICLLVPVFAFMLTRAQQITRFAYIQTDNKQPFYVKWNNKVWSSSTSGYLILSKIKDQQINLVVGFPKNLYPEQSFTVVFTGNKDAGFLLKDFGEKGWGLYNLQSSSVVYSSKETSTTVKEEIISKPAATTKIEEAKSPFGDLLVQVTQDSTVRNIAIEKPQPPVVIKQEPVKPLIDSSAQKVTRQEVKPGGQETKTEIKPQEKVITASENKKADVKTITTTPDSKPIVTETKKEEKVVEKETAKTQANIDIPKESKPVLQESEKNPQSVTEIVRSNINLFATNENIESYDYIYITEDKTGVKDTVSVSIKKAKQEIRPVIKTEPETKDSVIQTTKEEPKFIEIIADSAKVASEPPVIEPVKKDTVERTVDTVAKAPVMENITQGKTKEEVNNEVVVPKEPVKEATKEVSKAVMVNTDCKIMASEKDFMTLRKKMVAEENDDDMVAAARKVFKNRCFTTDQVKNLCVLFLKDEGRYKFLDAAYPYVYDTDNFRQLSTLLTEEYYLNRFKAMIKN